MASINVKANNLGQHIFTFVSHIQPTYYVVEGDRCSSSASSTFSPLPCVMQSNDRLVYNRRYITVIHIIYTQNTTSTV